MTGERQAGDGRGETGGVWGDARHALGRLARGAQRALEGLLHPLRRRLARERLVRAAAPSAVLVICLGNICRSPYAAALLRRSFGDRGSGTPGVESAGFLMLGRPVPEVGQQVAARRGIDLSAHRSQIITAAVAQAADLIVVMDGEQERAVRAVLGAARPVLVVLGDLDPGPIETRAVRDPIGQAAAVFEATYNRIDRCVGELVAAMTTGEGGRGKGDG